METPLGLFYVQAKFDPTWPVLGAYAFETSGYSKLSDWPGGGVVGVHGTNTPDLIGEAVSHGCVRLYNKDIQYLRSVVGRRHADQDRRSVGNRQPPTNGSPCEQIPSYGAQASRRGDRGARVPGGGPFGRPVDRRQPVTAEGGRRRRHDQRPDAARAQGAERPLVRDRPAERVPAAGLPAAGHPRDREARSAGAGEAKAGQASRRWPRAPSSPPGTRSPSRAGPTAARAG